MRYFYLKTILLLLAFCGSLLVGANLAAAETAAEIDRGVKNTLEGLYAESPAAKVLGQKAKGILVFPSIVKGGFIVGGQYGNGALLTGGKTFGYYNTVQASYGLQAGLQTYGYVLFFMTKSAMRWLDKSDGWELGIGPTIVVLDDGTSISETTTTLQSDVYAFFFDEKGLMGGLGLQGTKITRIEK